MTTRKIQLRKQIRQAIVDGMKEAENKGYTKPFDIALFIHHTLSDRGFQIVENPE